MQSAALATAVLTLSSIGGCSSAPAQQQQQQQQQPAASGPASFWTRSRLLSAEPFPGGDGHEIVPAPGQTANPHTALTALRVGALFVRAGSADHFCTASVVDSPAKNLLVTAAHCINGGDGSGYKQDIVFIPDYRDGNAPYGIWTPERLLVASEWATSANPNDDVGFVVLESHDGQNIEQILGGDRLAIDSGYRFLVRVTGYPDSADAPITCLNWTSRQSASQLQFDCNGYTDGTSGSPWVAHFDPQSRTGTIVGVVGGYQQGGDTSSVSYSAYFSSEIHQLYEQAIADGTPAS
jgi:V8-like Glu-specific endopeptidase